MTWRSSTTVFDQAAGGFGRLPLISEDAIYPTVPQILTELNLQRELNIDPSWGRHWLAYVIGDEWVASLSWNSAAEHPVFSFPANVDSISVRADLRRRGVATALWHEVKSLVPSLHHAHASEHSEDGAAWIAAVGGPVIQPWVPDSDAPPRQRRGMRPPDWTSHAYRPE